MMARDFRRRFWACLAASVPVLVLSPMIQSLLGYSLGFPGERMAVLVLSTFVFAYGGFPFMKGMVGELGDRRPGMMTLIALAVGVSYLYSAGVVLGLRGRPFFWELVTLIDVMLLGHWIEMRSVMGASGALEALVEVMPSKARRLSGEGSQEEVPVRELEPGDRVLIRPGERVPVDGIVREGRSEMDLSMVTGESQPTPVGESDEVIGGSVNGNGSLTVEVTGAGEDSYLSRMVRMVGEARGSRSRAQALADRAAFWLTLLALAAGAATMAAWLLIIGRDLAFSLERTVTVMVITCPHALGLAVPLVIATITTISARNGLLVRDRTSFEEARALDTVVFDKTGTLTTGELTVAVVEPTGDWTVEELLARAAAVESRSEHGIAEAITGEASARGLAEARVAGFEALPGRGARAEVDGEDVAVGNRGMLEDQDVDPGDGAGRAEELASEGRTVVYVVSGGRLQGLIALSDTLRERSAEAVLALREAGIGVAMLTGDNEATARAVAGELGIEEWYAGVLPDGKSDLVRRLQSDGRRVAMVGDGINDAPALAAADVGIAIGAGTDIAAETADVILVESDPRGVADAVSLSRLTRRKMVQNLAWATGYNVLAIPLAAGVLYPLGIVLPPAVGALVMSLSTVIVAVNARLVSFERTG